MRKARHREICIHIFYLQTLVGAGTKFLKKTIILLIVQLEIAENNDKIIDYLIINWSKKSFNDFGVTAFFFMLRTN